MIIYLTGILITEPLYINTELRLSFFGDNIKGFDIDNNEIVENIKPIRKDISIDLLKTFISGSYRSKMVETNKRTTYTLVKIEMLLEDISELELDELIEKDKRKQSIKRNNPISKALTDTKRYFSELIGSGNKYIIEFKEQKGCGLTGIFNDFEDISQEQLKKINKLPCIFDSRILMSSLNSEEYADGCIHNCAKSVLDEHPGIKAKVIERFLRCLDNGIYDKLLTDSSNFSNLPQLISDKELEYISNFQKQNMENLEKRFKLNNQPSKQTLLNKKKNLILFNGNNLNPLPLELFNLWRDILKTYDYFIRRFEINTSIISQWDIIPFEFQEIGDDSHYEELSLEDKNFLFPFNSSIVMSLYKDEELEQELFYIAIQFPPLDIKDFNNKNQLTLVADEYLKNIYYYWKNYREENIRKYNKEYKQSKSKILSETSQDFICQNCLLSETCNRSNCYLSLDDFDLLINKNNKLNLYIHKLGSPMMTINEWKHIIDNITSIIDIYQFNICGDEPLLFSELIELTRYIRDLGIKCSLETSGLFLTEKWLKQNIQYYEEITISLDSFDEDACAILGKINKDEKYLTGEDISNLVSLIHTIKPECVVTTETKVMQINKHEKMLENMKSLSMLPNQWRIVKYEVTDNDFMFYINKNFADIDNFYTSIPGVKILVEDETNNYSFIDNNGVLCKKVNKKKKDIIDIATETFIEDISKQKIKIFDD